VTAVPEKNALHVCFELSTTDQKTAETLTSRESHLVRYHSLPEIENILLAYGYELLEAGPFFDESQSIRDAWNFYICARKGTR
jgi:hypothetical protein